MDGEEDLQQDFTPQDDQDDSQMPLQEGFDQEAYEYVNDGMPQDEDQYQDQQDEMNYLETDSDGDKKFVDYKVFELKQWWQQWEEEAQGKGPDGQNLMWEDPDFPADDNSLYIDPLNLPTYATDNVSVEWKRPQEIQPNNDREERAVLWKDKNRLGEAKSGILDDNWLLGAFTSVSLNPNILRNLKVKNGIEFGYMVFKFFKNGEWQYVRIDTRIPFNSQQKVPLYGQCIDPYEYWIPLMEKAYAKLHKTYEILNDGDISEALVDLTGMVAEEFDLTTPEMKANYESGQLWKDLKKYMGMGFLVSCMQYSKEDDTTLHQQGPKGLLHNQLYSIMRMEHCADFPPGQTQGHGLNMLQLRNPWGQGAAEWVGPFSDDDETWDDNKGLKEYLNYEFNNSHNSWMKFEDWKANFNKVYVTKIFPAWKLYGISSEWKGNTAGGEYPWPQPQGSEEAKGDQQAKLDTNDRWFNNPQFRVSVTKKTQVIISLMQEDKNITGRPIIQVNFLVVRVKNKYNRLWQLERDDIVHTAAVGGSTGEKRELTVQLTLHPQHKGKNVHYIIVPNTEVEGRSKEEERPFHLRIFASETIEFYQLPNTVEFAFQNRWNNQTAGGKRVLDNGKENQLWSRNPQYFLNVKKPTHVKIILRKKGGKRIRGCLGLTVCKANGPTTPPTAQIIGKGKDKKKTPSSIPQNGMTYAQTLKTMVFKAEKGSDNIPDFEPPILSSQLERKLQILPNEWYEETNYVSDDVSAHYSFYQATQGPFIIVPSMYTSDTTAEFTLTIFSSHADIEVIQLQDSMNAVLASKWSDKTAGGCHLYDKEFEQKPDQFTWMNNPKFLLKLDTIERVPVKITLSRPDKAWKNSVGQDLVGCMIGFYVYQVGQNPTKDTIINTTGCKFVPWNELCETVLLEGNENVNREGYIIMPSTYESGKQGPFVIAVSTTVEFSLTQLDS